MNTPQFPATMPCPACGAPNPAVARFCGACRTQLQATAYVPPPPPPPPPSLSQFGMASAGGTTIAADVQTAFQLALQGLQAGGAKVVSQAPPYSMRVSASKGGIRYEGDLALMAVAPTQTMVRLSLKVTTGWIVVMALSALISLSWGAYMPLGGLVALVGWGFIIWHVVFKTPPELSAKLLSTLAHAPVAYDAARNGVIPGAYTPAPAPPRPQPSVGPAFTPPPAPPAPAPQPTATNAPAQQRPNVVEILRRLEELKNAGALSQAEFDAKKAELIARLTSGAEQPVRPGA